MQVPRPIVVPRAVVVPMVPRSVERCAVFRVQRGAVVPETEREIAGGLEELIVGKAPMRPVVVDLVRVLDVMCAPVMEWLDGEADGASCWVVALVIELARWDQNPSRAIIYGNEGIVSIRRPTPMRYGRLSLHSARIRSAVGLRTADKPRCLRCERSAFGLMAGDGLPLSHSRFSLLSC